MTQREKSIRNNTGMLAALFGIIAIIAGFKWSEANLANREKDAQIEILTNRIDSLRDEHFNVSVESGRDELTLDTLFKKFPGTKEFFETYRGHETE